MSELSSMGFVEVSDAHSTQSVGILSMTWIHCFKRGLLESGRPWKEICLSQSDRLLHPGTTQELTIVLIQTASCPTWFVLLSSYGYSIKCDQCLYHTDKHMYIHYCIYLGTIHYLSNGLETRAPPYYIQGAHFHFATIIMGKKISRVVRIKLQRLSWKHQRWST